MFELQLPQLPLWPTTEVDRDWPIRESRRARRLAVRVYRDGRVEVVVPERTSQRTITRFLDLHRDWIERKQTEARRNFVPAEAFPPRSIELGACRETWRIHVAGGAGRARIKVQGPGLLGLHGNIADAQAARRALRRWLTSKAYDALRLRLGEIARKHGFKYSKVAIRRQRTRWGSCSKRGTISLNVALLFQPPDVVDYLLVHELCHTKHMNHSKRFWQCVASCCADYRRLDRALLDCRTRVPAWVFS